jgi:bacillithiol system protein YtxJ
MNINWKKIQSALDLDKIHEASFNKPQLIFKHSTRCSISSAALDRVERQWPKETETEAHFLDLIAFRALSDAVTDRYQIEHESPQALLISKGKCILHQSHFQINTLEFSGFRL